SPTELGGQRVLCRERQQHSAKLCQILESALRVFFQGASNNLVEVARRVRSNAAKRRGTGRRDLSDHGCWIADEWAAVRDQEEQRRADRINIRTFVHFSGSHLLGCGE